MAYTKTTWNNLSDPPINADNLNKIEQGIYNNSLGIDKINPSGIATIPVEIEEGQITDAIGFKSLKLKGQTSQYTTTGKNFLKPIGTSSSTSYGITRTTNSDGSVTLSGTASADTYLRISDFLTLESNTAYTTLNQNANLPTGVIIYYNDVSNIGVTYNDTVIPPNGRVKAYTTGTVSGTTSIALLIQSGTSFSTPLTLYPMLVKGTLTTSNIPTYEPYTGGKASPNPDFPSDVNNVSGDNVIRISNKNLIEDETFVQGSSQDSTGTKRISCRNIKLDANTRYTFSSNLNYSTYNVAIGTSKNKFPTTSIIYDSGWKSGTFSFTTGADDVYCNLTVKKVGELVIAPSDVSTYHFQIEQNNSATSYIAHQGNNFSIDLPVENLLDITTADRSNQGVNLYNNHNGTVTLNGKATSTSGGLSLLSSNTSLPVSTFNGTITFSVKEPLPTGVELAFAYGDSTGAWISNIARLVGSTKSVTATINPPSNAVYFRVNFSVASGTELKNLLVCPQLEKGNKANAFTPYGTNPIELCKIGTYQDYIYKKDGKWWKHKAIGKKVLDGTENWTAVNTNTSGKYRAQINLSSIVSANLVKPSINTEVGLILSDHFKAIIAGTAGTFGGHEGISLDLSGYMQIYDDDYNTNDISLFKTWLANNNTTLYWVYSTPEDEEITYAPLIRQLDELYDSGLYDVTNISQDNSSEAFILDIEACKNNINGIVEYIRR